MISDASNRNSSTDDSMSASSSDTMMELRFQLRSPLGDLWHVPHYLHRCNDTVVLVDSSWATESRRILLCVLEENRNWHLDAEFLLLSMSNLGHLWLQIRSAFSSVVNDAMASSNCFLPPSVVSECSFSICDMVLVRWLVMIKSSIMCPVNDSS